MFSGLPDSHADPLVRGTGPRIRIRIRIRTKMSRIPSTGYDEGTGTDVYKPSMQRFLVKCVTLQVVIYVDDVNDNSPSFPSQVAQLTFSEGSTPGKLKRESVDKSYPTVPPSPAKLRGVHASIK